MHRLHRDSHIAARARFRPLNETHYQLRKTNPIFFIRSSSLRKARTRADEIRSPFPLLLFLFLFPFSFLFFFFHPSRVLRQGCRSREQYASQAPSIACSAAFFLECAPPPSRYVSRDPQKTSTPRTHNLISFSRLVTATTPRAGILRRLACQLFVPLEKEGGKEAFNASYFPRNHPPPGDNMLPDHSSLSLPNFPLFSPLYFSKRAQTNLYIPCRN